MNVGILKAIVAAYFEKTVSDLTVNTVDLGLVALNNARKTIEKQRDWFYQQIRGQLLVDPTNGAQLGNMAVYGDEEIGVATKSVETFYLTDTSTTPTTLIPLFHHGKQTVMNKAKNRYQRRLSSDGNRYRSDDESPFLNTRTTAQVYLHAGVVYLNPPPSEATTVVVDCYQWMDDYTEDADTDWLIENGADYLQWKAIIELNHLWGQFVSTQDGNVPPPQKLVDEALAVLIEWDSQLYEAGRQPRATNA